MNYDSFATTFSDSRKKLFWPELDEILRDIQKNAYTSFLDIGCGNGRFLLQARERGIRETIYLGIDNSPRMLDEARLIVEDAEFRTLGMEELEQLGNTTQYDAIIFLASFHHLDTEEKRKKVLKDLHALLKENGTIYMTNWNLRDQENYKKNHHGNGDFHIKIGAFERYYHGFELAELESLFHETGWHVSENRIFEWGRNIFSVLTKIP